MDTRISSTLALPQASVVAPAKNRVIAPGTVYQDRRGVTYKVLHSGAHVRLSPRPSGHR